MHKVISNIDMLVDAVKLELDYIDERDVCTYLLNNRTLVNEYYSVKIGLPRRSGNTTLGIKVAQDYIKNNKSVLFCCFTNLQCDTLRRKYRFRTIVPISRYENYVRGCEFDLIIVDSIGHLLGDEFYDITLPCFRNSKPKYLFVG